MKHGERKTQILDLIRQRGSVSLSEVTEHCGITRGNASVALWNMTKRGELAREGGKQKYRYRIAEGA